MYRASALRWDAGTERWWWSTTDGKLNAYSHSGKRFTSRPLYAGVSLIAPCTSGSLILGMDKRLCLLPAAAVGEGRPRKVLPRTLAIIDAADRRTLISNGRVDHAGRLVFGTRNSGTDGRPIASFFQFALDTGLRRLALPTMTTTANICFSHDGQQMYFADPADGVLMCCRYDSAQAQISDIRPFAHVGNGARLHDAIVDGNNLLWTLQGHEIIQFDAEGGVQQRIALPPDGAHSLAIGGPALDVLAVIHATGKLTPLSGIRIRGRAEPGFNDLSIRSHNTAPLAHPD